MPFAALLKIAVTVREIEIYYRKTQHHHSKIENAKLGRAPSTPGRGPRQSQVKHVKKQHEKSDRVLRVVIPVLADQAIDRDESQGGPNGDGDEPDDDAGMAHAVEQIQRGEPPNHVAKFAAAQEALFAEENEAQDKGEREGGVSQNAERHVKSENYAVRGRRGKTIGGRQVRGKEKNENERKDESSHRSLSMI